MRIEELSLNSGGCVVRETARLYCEIWKEPPWNEDSWTVPEVSDDIFQQAEKPAFLGLVAAQEDEVLGFTWGYAVDRMSVREIAGHEKLDLVFSNGEQMFYIAELGVVAAHRGKKIGEQLTRHLIDLAKEKGINSVLLRTNVKAERARALYAHLGFVDLCIEDEVHKDRTYWLLRI